MTGSTLTAIDPATGAVIREVPAASGAEIEQTLVRAEEAFDSWRRTDFSERADVLNAVAAELRRRREDFALLMTEEMGKPIGEARGEVDKAAWAAEHYAQFGAEYLAEDHIDSDATRSYVQYLPLGTVLGILPWNAPFWLAFRFCAPALMAGNTAVMKPDPMCPGAVRRSPRRSPPPAPPRACSRRCWRRPRCGSGDPGPADRRGLVHRFRSRRRSGRRGGRQRDQTGGAGVGRLRPCDRARRRRPAGGRRGHRAVADHQRRAVLHRGETDHRRARGPRRVRRVAARATGRAHRRRPRDEAVQIGPIARADLRDNLHRQVTETVAAGAQCVLGGELPSGPGFFYPVTLLTGVHPGMTACAEETFGPVAAVLAVEDAEQALAIANDTPTGWPPASGATRSAPRHWPATW